ncbi:hypothetical protein Ancab_008974 [Ancistrocladus abbreviatus]
MNLDDLLSESSAAAPARAGGKFKPKAKPRPRKTSSAAFPSVVKVSEEQQTAIVSTGPIPTFPAQPNDFSAKKLSIHENSTFASADITGTQEGLFDKGATISEMPLSESNLSMPMTEILGSTDVELLEIASCIGNVDSSSNLGKPTGENADIFLGLDSLDDLIAQSTSTAGPETPHASNTQNAEDKHVFPMPSSVNGLLPGPCNGGISCALLEPSGSCKEVVTSINDRDTQIESEGLETKEAGPFSWLDPPDTMCEVAAAAGRRAGKIPPKPKPRDKNTAAFESVSYLQDTSTVHSETQHRFEEGPVHAGPPDVTPDFPSMRFDDAFSMDPTTDCSLNQEPGELLEAPQPSGFVFEDIESLNVPGTTEMMGEESWKSSAPDSPQKDQDAGLSSSIDGANEIGNASRTLRKRTVGRESLAVSDNEDQDNEGSADEAPDKSVDDDDDYREEETVKKKKASLIAKKAVAANDKPVRKRKKRAEAAEQSEKQPRKKFSHSTRRKRCVDKSLLEMPEHEIDFQRLPIRDLIILAEIKERQAKKEAAKVTAAQTDARPDNSLSENQPYRDPPTDDDEVFASYQGTDSIYDHPSSSGVRLETGYYNYHSFMNKPPTVRWLKEDTELFYQGVSQFGSDLSMIQQLFPGRTRHQIKLKYKEEERLHPMRLHDALTSKPKDLSHYELVMEKLREQIAREEREEGTQGDSFGITGEEEGPEESAPETHAQLQEETAKSELKEEGLVADRGAGFSDVQSPARSHDSDDDDYRWSQYKSEL